MTKDESIQLITTSITGEYHAMYACCECRNQDFKRLTIHLYNFFSSDDLENFAQFVADEEAVGYRKERIMYNITFFDTQGIAVVNEDYEYDSYDNCEEYCKLVVTKNAFIRGYKISLSETAKQEIQEEFDSLMQAGIDEITDGNINEIATEYFTDAAYVLNKVQDVEFKEYLETKYPINPQDFAQ